MNKPHHAPYVERTIEDPELEEDVNKFREILKQYKNKNWGEVTITVQNGRVAHSKWYFSKKY